MREVTLKWNPGAKKTILHVPDKVMYEVARRTLDLTYPHIPLSKKVNSGRLRLSSVQYGVKNDGHGYSIGSNTSYAKHVWNMGIGTNWSTPGTFGKWYAETWKKRGNSIIKSAVERNKLK